MTDEVDLDPVRSRAFEDALLRPGGKLSGEYDSDSWPSRGPNDLEILILDVCR